MLHVVYVYAKCIQKLFERFSFTYSLYNKFSSIFFCSYCCCCLLWFSFGAYIRVLHQHRRNTEKMVYIKYYIASTTYLDICVHYINMYVCVGTVFDMKLNSEKHWFHSRCYIKKKKQKIFHVLAPKWV